MLAFRGGADQDEENVYTAAVQAADVKDKYLATRKLRFTSTSTSTCCGSLSMRLLPDERHVAR